MANNDLAFDNQVGADVDVNYELLFGQGLGEDVAERQVGNKTIEKFDYYVGNFEGGKANFTAAGDAGFRLMARIAEGPDGTENSVVFGGQVLKVKETKTVNTPQGKEEVQRTPEEIEKAASEIRKTLNRLVQVFEAASPVPAGMDEASLGVYASQFSGGPVVFAVSYSPERTVGDRTFAARNEIVLRSIAHPDEPVLHTSGKMKGQPTGETALQEARRKIKERNERNAKMGGTSGRTAGSFGKPGQPSEF